MPIRWSALKVSEAMAMAEEIVNEIIEPLERAKIVIDEAQKISDLPDYMKQRISSLESEVSKVLGGSHYWSSGQETYPGSIQRAIESVRNELPDGAIEAEREKLKHGAIQSLM